MPELSILTWPDPRLAKSCAPVGAPDAGIEELAEAMLRAMYAAPGRGLAAPQVGILRRLFVMDVTWKEGSPEPGVYIDPVILEAAPETATAEEGCLSIPGIVTPVERPERVRIAWTGLDGARHEAEWDGALARCAQHEIDHLDGIVTLDRLPAAAREEALSAYLAARDMPA